jgi:hypothetical protein
VVSYTTVSPLPGPRVREFRTGERGRAVCFLWHCPAGLPGLPLATTLPCGVRTFLDDGGDPPTRPPGRLIRTYQSSSAGMTLVTLVRPVRFPHIEQQLTATERAALLRVMPFGAPLTRRRYVDHVRINGACCSSCPSPALAER